MGLVLRTHWEDWLKIPLILIIGYLVFFLAGEVRHWSYANLPVKLLFEPLLICMVASFWVTNRSPYRSELRHLLHRIEMPVFVIFFTLIGGGLDIGIVMLLLPVTVAIFLARLLALFIGGYIGGTVAGDPPQFNRLTWMAYITPGRRRLGLGKGSRNRVPGAWQRFHHADGGGDRHQPADGTTLLQIRPSASFANPTCPKTLRTTRSWTRSSSASRINRGNWRSGCWRMAGASNSSMSTARMYPACQPSDGLRHEHWLPEVTAEEIAKIIEPQNRSSP